MRYLCCAQFMLMEVLLISQMMCPGDVVQGRDSQAAAVCGQARGARPPSCEGGNALAHQMDAEQLPEHADVQ